MPLDQLLVPVRKLTRHEGQFRWPRRAVLARAEPADDLPLGQLAADLKARLGVQVALAPSKAPAAVRVRRSRNFAGAEAYRLAIGPDGVEITAASDAGAYYAAQTLRDLAALSGPALPCCRIEDNPDFLRRGVYHDCSRGKVPTLDTLKALVERLAHWKINELQLYVENVFTFRKHPAIGQGYSPFTPEELLQLQDHCRLHHVRLVGSQASFGHMEKILALPEYQHLGEMPGHRDYPGGTTLCPIDEGSIALMADLFEEFLPLFEAEDFNVCCDETWELGKGRSKEQAGRVGVGRVYLDFLLKLRGLCVQHGKRMNAWADIVLQHPELLGELPKDVVMLNWDYDVGGQRVGRSHEITDAGLPLVVCPGTSSWQAHGTRLANAIGNVAAFAAEGRKQKAEGLLNTDWGDAGHRNFLGASLHGFAHGAAHAWNGAAVDDADFTRRFCRLALGQADDRLADFLTVLGNTYVACGAPHGNQCALYHALVEPLRPPAAPGRRTIEGIPRDGAERVLEELIAAMSLPDPPRGLDGFEVLALAELALAARMDGLACHRAQAAADLREGKAPAADAFASLAEETRGVADDFQRLWLARNKPSRLADNMDLFEKAHQESLALAGKA